MQHVYSIMPAVVEVVQCTWARVCVRTDGSRRAGSLVKRSRLRKSSSDAVTHVH
jgi:hypothetical protein